MYAKFKQLGKESVIYGLGGVASKFIGFFLLPVYTRVFNPADYGIMDVIATMTALAGIILTAGTETALSYYFYKFRDPVEQRKTVTTTGFYLLAINALVAAIVWLASDRLSVLAFDEGGYGVYLRVAILSIPFSSLMTLNFNVLRLQRRPWSYVGLSLSQFLFTVLLNIYLVVILRVGIIGVFWTNVIAAFLFSATGIVVNRSYFGKAFEWKRLAQLLSYGLPLVIGGLSMWSINYLDRYFLLRFSTLEQIGLYSVGLRLASVVAFLTWAFRLANAPFQFEMASEQDAPQIYSRTLTYYVLITSLICVPLSLFARPALRLLTTEAYVDAYKVVPFAAYSAVAYGAYQLVGVGLLVTKKTGFTGLAIGAGALVNTGYLFALVPPLGIVGAALAVLLTHVTVVILLYIGAQRAYFIPYDLGRVLRVLVCAGIVIGGGTLIRPQGFWADVLIAAGFCAIFLVMLPTLSLVEPREQRVILDKLRLPIGPKGG